jgi:pimeloyl-ACP methyl ester carboxylesterase
MRILALILAACAAGTLNWSGAAHCASASTAPSEERLAHISVVKRGTGPAVVLIPGLASPRASWDLVTKDLAKDHSIYLVQVNGFGGDAPGANLSPAILDGIVADLSDYLARHKVPPVRMVGHSMGGLASLMFARAHPAQVERVMLVDALPYFPVLLAPGGPVPAPDQVDAVARLMRDKVASRYGKPIDAETVKADVEGLAVKPASRAEMAKWAAMADPRVTAQLLYEDMSTDLRPALPGLSLPITVVVPWTDKPFGEERTLAFYRRQFEGAPNVRFAPIAEAGHFVMLDQPERFAAALREFLR